MTPYTRISSMCPVVFYLFSEDGVGRIFTFLVWHHIENNPDFLHGLLV